MCTAVLTVSNGQMPGLRDDVYCVVHGKTVQIIEASPTYTIRCQDCRYSRVYGNAMMTAETFAAKHAISRWHRVAVYRGATFVRMVGEHTAQLSFDDVAPF